MFSIQYNIFYYIKKYVYRKQTITTSTYGVTLSTRSLSTYLQAILSISFKNIVIKIVIVNDEHYLL